MKALITGINGFVGPYLREELSLAGYEVTGLSRKGGSSSVAADLMDGDKILECIGRLRPDVIFHLAGQSNVGLSWREPGKTIQNNVVGALNLLEAVRIVAPGIRVVFTGSSDQYGSLKELGACVREDSAQNPQSPYAVSKKAQEELARLYYRAYGLNISMTRSFNHSGAGQREGFVISDFSAGIARIEKGLAAVLKVGNLSSKRDFTHVRDVVRAYRLIAERGYAGEIYNVGSGEAHSAQEILDILCSMAKCEIPVSQDPDRMRASDTPVICCCHDKLTAHTGWLPQYQFEDILSDCLNYYRSIT